MLAVWEIKAGSARLTLLDKRMPQVSVSNWKASKGSTLVNRKTNSFIIPNLTVFKGAELKDTSLSFLYLCS